MELIYQRGIDHEAAQLADPISQAERLISRAKIQPTPNLPLVAPHGIDADHQLFAFEFRRRLLQVR